MSLLEEYPKTVRNKTTELRALLARIPGVDRREGEDLARAINGLADKAVDLNDIFQRLVQEPATVEELADLLTAFELTVEQIRGDSDAINGKLYEMADRLRGKEC